MIQRNLNQSNSIGGVRTGKPRLPALVGLDRHTLEDIGVSTQEVAACSPPSAVWKTGVIAGGLSARWNLSSDWDRI